MTTVVLAIAVALAVSLGYLWRASVRLRRLHARLEQAWAETERALEERDRALRGFLARLSSLGLVPQGRNSLEEALQGVGRARGEGPRALAEADERLKLALRAVYGGLPRQRPPALREAQNLLAEAEDELDLARRRYNELVVDWTALVYRRTYRLLANRLGLSRREPYLLPGEEAEFARRRGPAF